MSQIKGIRKSISKLKSSTFLNAFSLLASSSIIAQAITMIVAPISTRLFEPEDFGIYTLITTAVSLFGPIICLKYDMSIVTSKSERETYAVIKLCMLLCIPLSIVLSIFYGLVFLKSHLYGINLFVSIIAIIFLLIVYGFNNILIAHNNRNSLYKLLSSVTLIRSLINNALLVIGGFLHLGVVGLVGSQVFSSFAGVYKQSKDIRNNIDKLIRIDGKIIRKIAIEQIKQPIYNAPSALLTTSLYSSINLFIAKAYSALQLGLYSMSYRILGIPFSVISASIARIYFNSASKEYQKYGNYKSVFKKTFLLLLITIIPIITIIALISPFLFSFLFGKEWRDAGVYVRLLAPMFGIRLISESLTTGFIISGKQRLELIFQFSLFIVLLLIYTTCYLNGINIEYFLLSVSSIYVVFHTIMLITMYKLSKM